MSEVAGTKSVTVRPRKMINEAALLTELNVPTIAHASEFERVHTMALCSVLAAFDQQVTREAFIDVLNIALNFKGASAFIRSVLQTQSAHEKKLLTDEAIKASLQYNLELAQRQQYSLSQDVKLITECRGDEDQVN